MGAKIDEDTWHKVLDPNIASDKAKEARELLGPKLANSENWDGIEFPIAMGLEFSNRSKAPLFLPSNRNMWPPLLSALYKGFDMMRTSPDDRKHAAKQADELTIKQWNDIVQQTATPVAHSTKQKDNNNPVVMSVFGPEPHDIEEYLQHFDAVRNGVTNAPPAQGENDADKKKREEKNAVQEMTIVDEAQRVKNPMVKLDLFELQKYVQTNLEEGEYSGDPLRAAKTIVSYLTNLMKLFEVSFKPESITPAAKHAFVTLVLTQVDSLFMTDDQFRRTPAGYRKLTGRSRSAGAANTRSTTRSAGCACSNPEEDEAWTEASLRSQHGQVLQNVSQQFYTGGARTAGVDGTGSVQLIAQGLLELLRPTSMKTNFPHVHVILVSSYLWMMPPELRQGIQARTYYVDLPNDDIVTRYMLALWLDQYKQPHTPRLDVNIGKDELYAKLQTNQAADPRQWANSLQAYWKKTVAIALDQKDTQVNISFTFASGNLPKSADDKAKHADEVATANTIFQIHAMDDNSKCRLMQRANIGRMKLNLFLTSAGRIRESGLTMYGLSLYDCREWCLYLMARLMFRLSQDENNALSNAKTVTIIPDDAQRSLRALMSEQEERLNVQHDNYPLFVRYFLSGLTSIDTSTPMGHAYLTPEDICAIPSRQANIDLTNLLQLTEDTYDENQLKTMAQTAPEVDNNVYVDSNRATRAVGRAFGGLFQGIRTAVSNGAARIYRGAQDINRRINESEDDPDMYALPVGGSSSVRQAGHTSAVRAERKEMRKMLDRVALLSEDEVPDEVEQPKRSHGHTASAARHVRAQRTSSTKKSTKPTAAAASSRRTHHQRPTSRRHRDRSASRSRSRSRSRSSSRSD